MSVTTEIFNACLARVESFDYSPDLPVLWPGIGGDPPSEGMWLSINLFPNEPRDLAWDNNSCHETFGFFQIRVYYRPGVGQIEPSEVADSLIDYFPKGLTLGPVRVRKRPWQNPAVNNEDKLYIPITISWRGITE